MKYWFEILAMAVFLFHFGPLRARADGTPKSQSCKWHQTSQKVKQIGSCRLVKIQGYYGSKNVMKVNASSFFCGPKWKIDLIAKAKTQAKSTCLLGAKFYHLEYNVRFLWRWKHYVQLSIYRDSYTGGAHSASQFRTTLRHLKTGKEPTLKQLFPKRHKSIKYRSRRIFRRWPRRRRDTYDSCRDSFLVKKGKSDLVVVFRCYATVQVMRGQYEELKVPVHSNRVRVLRASQIQALQKIVPGKIQKKHSFSVDFVGAPLSDFVSSTISSGRTKAVFFFVKNGKITRRLPRFSGNQWQVHSIVAVGFTDLNRDGVKDIIVMADCMTGMGPQGARTFRCTSTYFSKGKTYILKPKWERLLAKKAPKTFRAVKRLARRYHSIIRK